jgi:hypothetical protein
MPQSRTLRLWRKSHNALGTMTRTPSHTIWRTVPPTTFETAANAIQASCARSEEQTGDVGHKGEDKRQGERRKDKCKGPDGGIGLAEARADEGSLDQVGHGHGDDQHHAAQDVEGEAEQLDEQCAQDGLPAEHRTCPAVIDEVSGLSEELRGASVRPVVVNAHVDVRLNQQRAHQQRRRAT